MLVVSTTAAVEELTRPGARRQVATHTPAGDGDSSSQQQRQLGSFLTQQKRSSNLSTPQQQQHHHHVAATANAAAAAAQSPAHERPNRPGPAPLPCRCSQVVRGQPACCCNTTCCFSACCKIANVFVSFQLLAHGFLSSLTPNRLLFEGLAPA